ncbi:CENP-B-like protein 2 [Golovinomyces cichoracearum]|uniref:CENP-B-like protein 2 n=1 Tax=Golovinomyces cichoracearum TaxID=62708 RepID=A0A420IPK2_9PEZI|nr:CENP-B-like protein 2 [Golovinomyces cichoracearum]
MELATAGRKRKAVTDAQRQALRKRKREHPGHQNELIALFKSQYYNTLNQSQVSKIISSSYDHLDFLDTNKDKCLLEVKRLSAGDWPDLEGALFEWQQRMQKNKAVITGDILKNQASKQ